MTVKSILQYVKPEIREISAYMLSEYEHEIKINQNENPYDVPVEIKREILELAEKRSWSRYPPFVPEDMKKALAEFTGWKSDGILVGNGSNELVQAIMMVFLNRDDKLVIPVPTFTLYRLIGKVLGAKVIEVPLCSDYTYDCDKMEKEFLDNGAMLIICSPNNPTGAVYPQDRLESLLEHTDRPILVDEAYCEFSGETVAGLIEDHDNLIVLRTFSKAFSLAGLRIGYAQIAPELAVEISKVKLPYNINFFSLAAAEKLLHNKELHIKIIEGLIAEREKMICSMNEIDGVTAYPSKANFILFETQYPPKELFMKFLDDGLLVRDVSSYPMLDKALRVSVSTPEDNKRFLSSLRKIMKR
ncbi:histidinol-phosphate transaminase [Candidatus Latescibacterota bacterium]